MISDQTKNIISLPTILASVILMIASIYLGYVPAQSDFWMIISAAGVAFGSYCYLSFYQSPSWRFIFIIGILIRCGLLFAFPNLSDDIYRFVWDGQLTAAGYNPYGYLPSDISADHSTEYWQLLYQEMNSPDYYTIYPPFTQLIFYISTWVGEHIWWNSFVIKLCFLLAEIFTYVGLIKLLTYLRRDERLTSIYWLNPLIIVEGIGNLHFEIIMICFFVWAMYYLFIKEMIAIGAGLFTLSIASKLLPLMFLPYFLFRMKGKNRIRFFTYGFIFIIVAFLPIGLGLDFANFGASIDLYFQKFEFNAGLYYLLRYIGQVLSGYNLIHYLGPLLGLVAVFLIVKKAIQSPEYSLKSFMAFSFFSFCTYLFLATTVHPWYLCIPVLLSVFVRWRFAIIWSFLIFLTYINYSYDVYQEHLWIVALEYMIVYGAFIYQRHRSSLMS